MTTEAGSSFIFSFQRSRNSTWHGLHEGAQPSDPLAVRTEAALPLKPHSTGGALSAPNQM